MEYLCRFFITRNDDLECLAVIVCSIGNVEKKKVGFLLQKCIWNVRRSQFLPDNIIDRFEEKKLGDVPVYIFSGFSCVAYGLMFLTKSSSEEKKITTNHRCDFIELFISDLSNISLFNVFFFKWHSKNWVHAIDTNILNCCNRSRRKHNEAKELSNIWTATYAKSRTYLRYNNFRLSGVKTKMFDAFASFSGKYALFGFREACYLL